jgi:uncharacterized membrane protein YphA (DoxX/SURF4 family)
MAVDAGLGAIALLVGRILFGGVLAFQGLNHFLNLDEMVQFLKNAELLGASLLFLALGTEPWAYAVGLGL